MTTATSARERRELIDRLARTAGLASVDELSTRFGVTASTIRRDLAILHREGRLARTYGGAIARSAHTESSLFERESVAEGEKAAIARAAAAIVEPGESLMLDGGSTVFALARELSARSDLNIVTTALNTLQLLATSSHLTVEGLGGRVRPKSGSMVGPIAEASLSRMTFDRVFLGADGVHARRGICEADRDQARLKELMVAASRETFVLADATKLGAEPFHAWTPLGADWTLITDSSASSDRLRPFRDAGVRVVVAPVED